LSISPVERRALANRADLESLTWPGCLSALCDLIESASTAEPTAAARRYSQAPCESLV